MVAGAVFLAISLFLGIYVWKRSKKEDSRFYLLRVFSATFGIWGIGGISIAIPLFVSLSQGNSLLNTGETIALSVFSCFVAASTLAVALGLLIHSLAISRKGLIVPSFHIGVIIVALALGGINGGISSIWFQSIPERQWIYPCERKTDDLLHLDQDKSFAGLANRLVSRPWLPTNGWGERYYYDFPLFSETVPLWWRSDGESYHPSSQFYTKFLAEKDGEKRVYHWEYEFESWTSRLYYTENPREEDCAKIQGYALSDERIQAIGQLMLFVNLSSLVDSSTVFYSVAISASMEEKELETYASVVFDKNGQRSLTPEELKRESFFLLGKIFIQEKSISESQPYLEKRFACI